VYFFILFLLEISFYNRFPEKQFTYLDLVNGAVSLAGALGVRQDVILIDVIFCTCGPTFITVDCNDANKAL
jgi:hypothetical protein